MKAKNVAWNCEYYFSSTPVCGHTTYSIPTDFCVKGEPEDKLGNQEMDIHCAIRKHNSSPTVDILLHYSSYWDPEHQNREQFSS